MNVHYRDDRTKTEQHSVERIKSKTFFYASKQWNEVNLIVQRYGLVTAQYSTTQLHITYGCRYERRALVGLQLLDIYFWPNPKNTIANNLNAKNQQKNCSCVYLFLCTKKSSDSCENYYCRFVKEYLFLFTLIFSLCMSRRAFVLLHAFYICTFLPLTLWALLFYQVFIFKFFRFLSHE